MIYSEYLDLKKIKLQEEGREKIYLKYHHVLEFQKKTTALCRSSLFLNS